MSSRVVPIIRLEPGKKRGPTSSETLMLKSVLCPGNMERPGRAGLQTVTFAPQPGTRARLCGVSRRGVAHRPPGSAGLPPKCEDMLLAEDNSGYEDSQTVKLHPRGDLQKNTIL